MISAGVAQWDKLTVPAIQSLEHHAKEPYELIVMDNGGKNRGDINTDKMIPYGAAVNATATLATHERLVILNNDITARGNWQAGVHAYPYCGPVLLGKEGVNYIEGWFISIEMDLWHMMNGFNPRYINSWEDVDLAWRLCRLGVHAKKITVPMKHIWGATRHAIPGSNKFDERNRQLLLARIRAGEYNKWRKL
jgi:hypothetical protein